MKNIFFLIMLMSALALSGQTLTIEDMVKNIRQFKDSKSIKLFVEKHGFDYDTVLLPGSKGKMYSFLSDQEYKVVGMEEDTLMLRNAVFVRMDDDVTIRKLTLMTASKEYYQHLVSELMKKNFKSKDTDRTKPMFYSSDLYKGVEISLSVVQAVKEDKPYVRYQVAALY